MANKWQKLDALRRRKIMSRNNGSPIIANRGHLFVYSSDGKRFMIPITYLNHNLFRELFRMSEEKFGLPGDGPITLPCDASCMKYIISLLHHGTCIDIMKVVLASIAGVRCLVSSLSLQPREEEQSLKLYGF